MRIKSLKYIDSTVPVYDLTVDTEEHNFTLGNGAVVHNCMSDSMFGGVSFKHLKNKVKIVAACNMAHSEMGELLGWGEAQDYNNAGSLDPALAARFAVYWKKNYDERDVRSWIAFMEKQVAAGEIDGTLLEYFKTLSPGDQLRTMASVEKRCLETAEPSTRMMFQLSKDIKSMRGKASANGFNRSLYNGRVLSSDPIFLKEFEDLSDRVLNPSQDMGQLAGEVHTYIEKLFELTTNWEPAYSSVKTYLNGKEYSADELLEALKVLDEAIFEKSMRPLTQADKDELRALIDSAFSAVVACKSLDDTCVTERNNMFKMYLGADFSVDFAKYFNSVFGTEEDVEITIEMLEDIKLIAPFIRKRANLTATLVGNDKIESILNIMREFWQAHSDRLPSKNYQTLISEICKYLRPDDIGEVLAKSGKDVDGVYACAEDMASDTWVMSILKNYPSNTIRIEDITEMRNQMAGKGTASTPSTRRRTRIL